MSSLAGWSSGKVFGEPSIMGITTMFSDADATPAFSRSGPRVYIYFCRLKHTEAPKFKPLLES